MTISLNPPTNIMAEPGPVAGSSERSDAAVSSGSVDISYDVLDGIVDDLFTVGLKLAIRTEYTDSPIAYDDMEYIQERLDSVLARIRRAVLACTRPDALLRANGPDATVAGSYPTGQELVDLTSLPNGNLRTLDLLDAAHSAKRALIVLQDTVAG